MSADDLIRMLHLQPHPKEGGFFRETYRAAEATTVEALPGRYRGSRHHSTCIYYLLTPGTFSALHRLQSDEIFHFYLGDPVRMLQLPVPPVAHALGSQGRNEPWGSSPRDGSRTIVLGPDLTAGQHVQVVVPRGVWQGSILEPGGRFALLGCTVAPGFEYVDYEHGRREELQRLYPEFHDLIERLTLS